MAEARTVAPAKGKDGKEGDGEGKKKLGKKKLLMLVGIAVLVLAAAAYWFLFMRGGSAEAAEKKEPAPEPGTVVVVDPISINLADGHYLKLGIALQQTTTVGEESVDGSKALDAAITLYSGKQLSELSDPTSREAIKEEFKKKIEHDYEDEVMDVYFTQYVMQ